MYRKSVLPNGLRVVTEELPGFYSVSLGLWLVGGSREETAAENGLTHFLEHMAFKGTSRRTAYEIAREIDQLGGAGNAFTTKESMCFHARVLADQLPRAVDLLCDLLLHPLYQPEDLERERQVILEEIHAQEDSPEDQIQVLFAQDFWRDHPFGQPILGTAANICRYRREDLWAYRTATLSPERLVVAAAGKLQHQALLEALEPLLANFPDGVPVRDRGPLVTHPGSYFYPRDLEQVHFCLGTPAVAAGDPRRYGVTLLQLILGGNMSSRLFQVVREQLGLAYNIYSFLSFFSDTGLLGIAGGVSPKNLPALLEAVSQELKKLKEQPLPDQELAGAKEYLKGSIYLHAEDCDQRMMRLAKNEINFGHYLPLEEIIAGLMQVTGEEVRELAQEFFRAENWGLTLLGPVAGERGGLDF